MMRELPREVIEKCLAEYARWDFEDTKTQYQVVVHEGVQYGVSFQEVCEQALDRKNKDYIQSLKFEALVEGMKKHGLEHYYQHIMRQPITEALVK